MRMTFTASLDQLHSMLAFIRGETGAIGFEGLVKSQIELALEEALVNIIKHGYRLSSGDISIECHPIYQGIIITLSDKGVPFNPCLATSQVSENNESYSTGGYGIYLMKTIMDHLDYQYCNGCNVFSLTKFLPKASA